MECGAPADCKGRPASKARGRAEFLEAEIFRYRQLIEKDGLSEPSPNTALSTHGVSTFI
jgi:hypothetical protein